MIGMAHVCDTIRTRDLLVRSQTLYPAELHTHITFIRALIGTNDMLTQQNIKVKALFSLYKHRPERATSAHICRLMKAVRRVFLLRRYGRFQA